MGNMALPPLKVKLAITSLFDKQSPDLEKQGWRAFENYVDFLRGSGAKHTATIVTKMKFDQGANYPKVIFSAERWLEPNELEVVKARMEDGSVASLLEADVATSTPALPPASPAVETAVVEEAPAPVAAPKPATKPAKPAKPAKPVVAPPVVEEEQEELSFELPAAAPAPAQAATESTEIPKELQDLLSEWDD
jgi:hypothetical protein